MPKTSELTGALLDYWVARAEGCQDAEIVGGVCLYVHHEEPGDDGWWTPYEPSTDWAQCGPLIEKYKLIAEPSNYLMHGAWYAQAWQQDDTGMYGATTQEAICRAVVRAAFGDDVPEVAPC